MVQFGELLFRSGRFDSSAGTASSTTSGMAELLPCGLALPDDWDMLDPAVILRWPTRMEIRSRSGRAGAPWPMQMEYISRRGRAGSQIATC